jgi:cell division protein FtsL
MFNLTKSTELKFQVNSREYRMVLVAIVGLTIGAMAFVWSDIRLVGLAYKHQILTKDYHELRQENHLLRVERGSLQSLGRIQSLAKRKIGLKEPDNGQIVTVFLKQ